jgi:hypothetical protein
MFMSLHGGMERPSGEALPQICRRLTIRQREDQRGSTIFPESENAATVLIEGVLL